VSLPVFALFSYFLYCFWRMDEELYRYLIIFDACRYYIKFCRKKLLFFQSLTYKLFYPVPHVKQSISSVHIALRTCSFRAVSLGSISLRTAYRHGLRGRPWIRDSIKLFSLLCCDFWRNVVIFVCLFVCLFTYLFVYLFILIYFVPSPVTDRCGGGTMFRGCPSVTASTYASR